MATMIGKHLDSVAEPLIFITVNVTRLDSNITNNAQVAPETSKSSISSCDNFSCSHTAWPS